MSHDEDLDDQYADDGMADIPSTLKALRACKRCSLLKTLTQFTDRGCENCPFLRIEESVERVHECTSSYFTGMIAMIDPPASWVAKWQHIDRMRPGIYAVQVTGVFPPQDQEYMLEQGISWRCKPLKQNEK